MANNTINHITTIPSNTICTWPGCDHRTELLSTQECQLFLIFSYVWLVSTRSLCHCKLQSDTKLPAALLWQQSGRLTSTCIWDIAQSATDTTEGGDESSYCLQALARWQHSSYPFSTILNPSGLNRLELESDNSPPLSARVEKTWTPYSVPCLIQDVSFIGVLSTAASRTESPCSPGRLICLAEGHG